VIELKQINLPLFLIGAGVVHLVGLAALLPMLITLPGPGGDIEPKAVVVDVDIVPAAAPSPEIAPKVDQTSALQTTVAPASVDQAPAPDAAVAKEKTKVESEGKARKPAKLTRTAPKKRVVSTAKGKSGARRPARPRASSQPPYKGPFSALFNAPPGATANKRK
jgi:hypothetical protein